VVESQGWERSYCKRLSEHPAVVIFLVIILKGPVSVSIEITDKILIELFEINEENVFCAAKFGW